MSRGTTLTLFKKYNLKMDDDSYNEIVKKYAEYNKKHHYSLFDDKEKSDEEYAKDIPPILHINPFQSPTEYDEKTKEWVDIRPPRDINNLRADVIGHVAQDDHCYCEELMEWTFGSSFDCLIDHYNIGHYDFATSHVIITPTEAQQMLAAINYILGGDWSDKAERAMNNPFIKIFTTGYRCDSYWKYVYRKKNHQKSFKIKQDGYDITIKCPVQKKDDEDEYQYEIDESNETIEYFLNTFRNGLTAFLCSDNWSRHEDDNKWLGHDAYNQYKYVLTYEYWG